VLLGTSVDDDGALALDEGIGMLSTLMAEKAEPWRGRLKAESTSSDKEVVKTVIV
jgi:hypothetical protein